MGSAVQVGALVTPTSRMFSWSEVLSCAEGMLVGWWRRLAGVEAWLSLKLVVYVGVSQRSGGIVLALREVSVERAWVT